MGRNVHAEPTGTSGRGSTAKGAQRQLLAAFSGVLTMSGPEVHLARHDLAESSHCAQYVRFGCPTIGQRASDEATVNASAALIENAATLPEAE
jgi:hypothetical protein